MKIETEIEKKGKKERRKTRKRKQKSGRKKKREKDSVYVLVVEAMSRDLKSPENSDTIFLALI